MKTVKKEIAIAGLMLACVFVQKTEYCPEDDSKLRRTYEYRWNEYGKRFEKYVCDWNREHVFWIRK